MASFGRLQAFLGGTKELPQNGIRKLRVIRNMEILSASKRQQGHSAGIGNAVGYALSGKRAAAKFNTPEHILFDHHIIALHGDGCLQEGVVREAIAFAGTID